MRWHHRVLGMRSAVGVEHYTPTHVHEWLYRATGKCALWARGGATHRQVGLESPAAARAQAGVSQAGVSGPRDGVLVMAHEPLTRGAGPRCVRGHRGVLVIALQSVAFGAGPR